MFVRCCLALFVLAQLILKPEATSSHHHQQQRQELTLSECAAKQGECDESEGPVCGTDDQTYPTRCHLLRVQCSGHQVSIKYRGSCKSCIEARQYASKHKARNPFVPRCKKDGTYAAMQCLADTGCWCSDSSGKPIANTSARTGKPRCRAYKHANRRRSPPRQLSSSGNGSGSGSSSNGSGGGHRPCNKADRAAFNQNLIEVFRSEHMRAVQTMSQSDAVVLDWKFDQLDVNGNKMLDKQEVRELKKLVKRAVKPRRCGRAFGKYCDVHKDDRLSRLEWNSCLAKDGSNRNSDVDMLNNRSTPSTTTTTTTRRTHYTNMHNIHTNPNHDHTNTNIIGNSNSPPTAPAALDDFGSESDEHRPQAEYDEDYGDEDGDEDEDESSIGTPHSRASLNYPPSFYFLNSKTEPTNNESEGDANCWTDQAVALEEQKQGGNSVLYVPQCMTDGRYQRVQCYRSTPYCWCVHEDTGKNIPGTSVKNKRPQCDEVSAVRPMKGCTEPRKTVFLKELKEFLKTQILSSSNTGINTTMWKTEDERIATLSFVFLDKNKNKSWERKEWKVFRELVTSARNLRKCGKKMPRYCDANGDKKISLSEWVSCLQSQPPENATTAKPTQSNETATSRLLGSNPLEQYLKD